MPSPTQSIVRAGLALAVAGIVYFVIRLYTLRKALDGLPQPKASNLLIGHIDIAADCERHFPADVHPHVYWQYVRKKYNLGKFFYVDWWPLGPRWLIIADPEIASQYATTGQSLLKAPLTHSYMHHLLGKNNMVTLEGQQWKHLRSIFNPGFAAAHLMTLVPYIVDASLVFCDILREKAASGELIEFEEIATRLTVDIIGKVVLDSDFNAQRTENPIVSTFRKQVSLMPPAGSVNPLNGFNPVRPVRLWWNGRTLDRLIGEELDKRFASKRSEVPSEKKGKGRKRSVIDLALEANRTADGDKSTAGETMTPTFRQNSIDSIKTFIFAGHDTTSSTIAYAFYLLHLHPHCHSTLTAELTSVFGPDPTPSGIATLLKSDPYVINRLEYTTAVIKETLRLFPPASTLRWSPPLNSSGTNLEPITDPSTGVSYPMNGFTVWPVAHTIHRNEDFFPSPTKFIPERFIQHLNPFPDAKLLTPAGKDAWRPFEKGPRNCIGQELAMIESKVILAMTVQTFDFVAEYDGARCVSVEAVETCQEPESRKNNTVEGHRVYQMLKGSAKPVDGMKGRVLVR